VIRGSLDRMKAALLTVTLLFVAASARADAMPSCPPGQHVVHNPATPGSGHHGGGHCEWGCSVAFARGEPAPLVPLALVAVLVARRRKRAPSVATKTPSHT
jgi:MYXO-CTERM domain-containing protein